MTFVDQWRTDLGESLVLFAELAADATDIDFTYGIMGTAVLWPVYTPIQEYDDNAIDAVRDICGANAKHVLKAVQDFGESPEFAARSLAHQVEQNEELGKALETIITYFDAVPAFSGRLAQVMVQRQGAGDVAEISDQINAALVNVGGITNIKTLAVTINMPYATRPPRSKRYWAGVGAVVLLALSLIGGALFYWLNRPLPPMSAGFNIAVAEFTAVDENGESSVTEESQQLSHWFFEAIEREVAQLSTALSMELRGPKDVGPVLGADFETRYANASKIAENNNARVLIYGTISSADGGQQIELEFYVSDEGFKQGSEVAGPNRLGKPIPVDEKLDAAEQTAVNEKLRARTEALRHVVTGLAQLYSGHYQQAWADFDWAAGIDEWADEEGKEVVYLLLGATDMWLYDPITEPEKLARAEASFREAREINPTYARVYLGLGNVALENAKIENLETGLIEALDEQKLVEAEGFIRTAQSVNAQYPIPLVTEKADGSLGQIHMLGYQLGTMPHWSEAEARAAFERVIASFEANGEPQDMAWMGAHAHGALGKIAGANEDWATMVRESRRAIDILERMPEDTGQTWIARYWGRIGLAEEGDGEFKDAYDAYQKAVEFGEGTVSDAEIAMWEANIVRLEKEVAE